MVESIFKLVMSPIKKKNEKCLLLTNGGDSAAYGEGEGDGGGGGGKQVRGS